MRDSVLLVDFRFGTFYTVSETFFYQQQFLATSDANEQSTESEEKSV